MIVEADIFVDGHDAFSAVLLYRKNELPLDGICHDTLG